MPNLKHEYSGTGFHRIVNPDKPNEPGEWAGYQGIAAYFDDDTVRTFVAVTGYHGTDNTHIPGLRENIIYLITPQEHVE
jgi:hypothetical protein